VTLSRSGFLIGGAEDVFEAEFQLLFMRCVAEFSIHLAGLNVFAVLVFLRPMRSDFADQFVKVKLTSHHRWVNLHWLDDEHFQRPGATITSFSQAGSRADEQSQPSQRTSALNTRDEPMRFRVFAGSTKVQLAGVQGDAAIGNLHPSEPIGGGDIQHHLFVNQQFVMKRKVVAVGVESIWRKRIDNDLSAEMATNFFA
jgi:hypothetical protein